MTDVNNPNNAKGSLQKEKLLVCSLLSNEIGIDEYLHSKDTKSDNEHDSIEEEVDDSLRCNVDLSFVHDIGSKLSQFLVLLIDGLAELKFRYRAIATGSEQLYQCLTFLLIEDTRLSQ